MTRRVFAALAAVLLLVGTGCDGGASSPEPVTAPTPPVDALVATARAGLVSPRQLPGLSGATKTLDADQIADEAADPAVGSRLDADGFVVAVRRDLRGRARDVTGADSRVLVFAQPQGAESFLESVAEDPDPFFGGPADVRPLSIKGAEGVLITPPMCACAGAQPVYVGLVADGSRLLWLQITGPRATAADVRDLLGRAVGA
jgi:hypothetical protein